jgi:DNA-binding transcriptional MerR regulator
MNGEGRLRIGELSRRVGVSPELLRAWETRYGLVDPERTSGGLRLYSDEDGRRVQAMKDQLARGLAASEAARLAKLGHGPEGSTDLSEIVRSLEEAFDALDEPAAQRALDRLFGSFALESALDGVILPFLRGVGERWARADLTVAGEHFTSNVIGGRLRALARGWGQGVGPRAVLACPPGEQHELGLVCFGLLLRERGWRITYLGAGTPSGDIEKALGALAPSAVVLAAVTPQRFEDAQAEIGELARHTRVAIGGAGASEAAAKTLGAELLTGGVVAGAAGLAP